MTMQVNNSPVKKYTAEDSQNPLYANREKDPRAAADTLVKVLNKGLDVKVDRDKLVALFRDKFSTLSLLAHALHNEL